MEDIIKETIELLKDELADGVKDIERKNKIYEVIKQLRDEFDIDIEVCEHDWIFGEDDERGECKKCGATCDWHWEKDCGSVEDYHWEGEERVIDEVYDQHKNINKNY